MKHIALVPLIGGMAIGAESAIGTPPEAVLSYAAFGGNDKLYMDYLAQRGIDVKRYDIEEDTIPNFGEIDIVTSVCPCAGLSSASTNSGAGCATNEWMKLSTRYALENIKPRVLVGENAPRLATDSGRPVAQALRDIGAEFGYSMQLIKTATHLHGIPQARERSFFILYRDTGPLEIEYSHQEYEGTWMDFLNSFETKEEETWTPSVWQQEMWELGKRIKQLEDDQFLTFLAETRQSLLNVCVSDNEESDAYVATYTESEDKDKARLARDITRCRAKRAQGKSWWDGSVFINGRKNFCAVMWRSVQVMWRGDLRRPITLREQMRLMGLPEDFKAPRAYPNAVCQNVPTCTAKWIVSEVIAGLNGERKEWDGEDSLDGILRQNNIGRKHYK